MVLIGRLQIALQNLFRHLALEENFERLATPSNNYSASFTKLSIMRLVPLVSNAISSLLPSWPVTVP